MTAGKGTQEMLTDPIVERLHKQREEYMERFQYDRGAADSLRPPLSAPRPCFKTAARSRFR
jgi:hypothetical protein